MENKDAKVTPERQAELAKLTGLFGIRPDTRFTTTISVFEIMDAPPQFTFIYMTTSAKEEYQERMDAVMRKAESDSPAPEVETSEEKISRVNRALQKYRKEHDGVIEWLLRKHLIGMEGYPDSKEGGFIEYKAEAGSMSFTTWDSIAGPLRPLLAEKLISRSFSNELESTAVKS